MLFTLGFLDESVNGRGSCNYAATTSGANLKFVVRRF